MADFVTRRRVVGAQPAISSAEEHLHTPVDVGRSVVLERQACRLGPLFFAITEPLGVEATELALGGA